MSDWSFCIDSLCWLAQSHWLNSTAQERGGKARFSCCTWRQHEKQNSENDLRANKNKSNNKAKNDETTTQQEGEVWLTCYLSSSEVLQIEGRVYMNSCESKSLTFSSQSQVTSLLLTCILFFFYSDHVPCIFAPCFIFMCSSCSSRFVCGEWKKTQRCLCRKEYDPTISIQWFLSNVE